MPSLDQHIYSLPKKQGKTKLFISQGDRIINMKYKPIYSSLSYFYPTLLHFIQVQLIPAETVHVHTFPSFTSTANLVMPLTGCVPRVDNGKVWHQISLLFIIITPLAEFVKPLLLGNQFLFNFLCKHFLHRGFFGKQPGRLPPLDFSFSFLSASYIFPLVPVFILYYCISHLIHKAFTPCHGPPATASQTHPK